MVDLKKKLVFVLSSNELDGSSRFVYELARQLTTNFEVTVFVPIIPRYKLFVLQNCVNLSFAHSLMRKGHYCFRWIAIDLFIRRLKWVKDPAGLVRTKRCVFSPPTSFLRSADYVILNSWYLVLSFFEFWETTKNKYIVCLWHYEHYDSQSICNIRDRVLHESRSITCSKNSADYIATKKIRAPEILFGIGIAETIFNVPDHENEMRKRSIDIAVYRGFEKRKGFDFGLEAVNTLTAKHELNCCIIQGSKRAITPWDYPVYAELPDKELADILRDTKIFLYPSLFEGFALPPLEAMACGCAVVTTNVGAVPDYACHMEDACIVTPGNTVEIVQAIEFLLDNPDEMRRIQGNATKKARLYSWSKTARNFTHLLEMV